MSFNNPANPEDAHLAQVYAKRPIAIVRGKGCLLYDSQGREYVDLAGGYGTCIVGHSHPRIVAAITQQATKLTSCHGSFYNDARALFVEKLASIAPDGLDRVFLANSGAESVEAAIKIARRSTGRRQIISVKGGFHGKTHGALSATWDPKYRKNFEPLLPDFFHVSLNDEESAKLSITNETAGVLVEPVQGEGGLRIPSKSWLSLISDLCRDTGSLLVVDEIQTGFGRTGKMFASEHFGIEPDILCLGKGIASGLPIGVTLAGEEEMSSLSKGEHTSTFGGNPLVSAAGAATIEVLLDENLVENAVSVGAHFQARLQKLRGKYSIVREARGLGLMLGLENRFEVYSILQKGLDEGVILLDAGRNILRFLPPLCINEPTIDRALDILDHAMELDQSARISSQAVA